MGRGERKWFCLGLRLSYACTHSAQLPGRGCVCVCSGFSTDILQEAAAGHKPSQLGMTSFLRVHFASRPRKAVVLECKKLLLSEG